MFKIKFLVVRAADAAGGGAGLVGAEHNRASNEGYPRVREDFTITEKAPTTMLNGR